MQLNLKTIAKTHAPQCLAVGAPILCAILIASVSVPLAMWAPIVDSEDAPRLASVATRQAPIRPQPKLTEYEARLAAARAYLVETAQPGYTMTRQGKEVAVERLHPEFALRLANAVREARAEGLENVGVFSAYRPPGFRVGGFKNKFRSLHAYGLAVDMHGIGRPGSAQTRLWHRVASRNDLSCPYGLTSRREWNHCQATRTKIVLAANPLTKTINGEGPVSLERMWGTAKPLIIKANDPVIKTNDPGDPPMAKLTSEIARLGEAHMAETVPAPNKGRFAKMAKSHKGQRYIRVAARSAKAARKG